MDEPLRIRPASPERRAEVLWLVFRHLSGDDRLVRVDAVLEAARSGRLSPDGLLEARRGDRLAGGVFAEIQVGRAAVVWPPRLAPGEPAATAEHLLARLCELLARERICVAHTLLEPGMEGDVPLLRTAGFEPLADLLYLASVDDHFPRSRPKSPLHFEPYSAASHGRLARLVEATYHDTLDCPRLNGLRQIEDILAGYRATGVFAPGRWLLVRHQDQDVGCLLLADHPEQENWELVYMGLVPSARGNGWGKHLARHAQWLTAEAGRPRLVVAVDAANTPAIRTYSVLGFETWDRKSVYLKVVEAPG